MLNSINDAMGGRAKKNQFETKYCLVLHDYEEMKNTEDLMLQEQLVESELSRAYTYEYYPNLLDELTALKRTTGVEQKESPINYRLLNNRRIRRWDKTLKLSETTNKSIEK